MSNGLVPKAKTVDGYFDEAEIGRSDAKLFVQIPCECILQTRWWCEIGVRKADNSLIARLMIG